jgi:flagellar basal-body rod protein FlgG
VRTVATQKLHSQGNIVQTNNSFDVAVQGRGFFQIAHPDGSIAYTRDGSFGLDPNGQLVTQNGYLLEPAITIPANTTSVTVGSDGTVSAQIAGNNAPSQIGNITLAQFINPTGLEAIGDNLYRESVGQRRAADRHPGTERQRHPDPGLTGELQRQRGRGTGQHDRDAAGLRDEQQGDLHGRQHAVLRQPDAVMTAN